MSRRFSFTIKYHYDGPGYLAWREYDTLDEAHRSAKEEIAKGNVILNNRITELIEEVKYHTV